MRDDMSEARDGENIKRMVDALERIARVLEARWLCLECKGTGQGAAQLRARTTDARGQSVCISCLGTGVRS